MAASSWPIIWTSSHRRSVSNYEMMDFSKVLPIRPVSRNSHNSFFIYGVPKQNIYFFFGFCVLCLCGAIKLMFGIMFCVCKRFPFKRNKHTPCFDYALLYHKKISYGWYYKFNRRTRCFSSLFGTALTVVFFVSIETIYMRKVACQSS